MTTSDYPVNKRPLMHFTLMPVDSLPGDKGQSNLLYQPKFRLTNIDPVSGEDVADTLSHPFIVDGNLTKYFQSQETGKDYIRMPLNHPALHLQFDASIENDRGG